MLYPELILEHRNCISIIVVVIIVVVIVIIVVVIINIIIIIVIVIIVIIIIDVNNHYIATAKDFDPEALFLAMLNITQV